MRLLYPRMPYTPYDKDLDVLESFHVAESILRKPSLLLRVAWASQCSLAPS